MNIGLYTSNVDGGNTGPGVYRENLSKALLDQHPQHNISLIHFKKSNSNIYVDGNEIIIPPPPMLSKLTELIGIDIDWGRMTNITADRHLRDNYNFDIIHLQNIPYRRLFWLWETDAKIVSTIHFGIRRFIHPEQYGWFDRERVKYIYKKLSNQIDGFITVTEESKRLHSKYLNIDPNKIYVTHNAAPNEFSPTQDPKVLEKYEIEDPYIFHLSNKNYYKNPEGILKGYEYAVKNYGFECDLVIGGGRWDKATIEQYIDNSSVLDRIHFLGYVPREDLPTLYTSANLFFLPSLSEAFPFVMVEALGCGTPVVTVRGFGMPEIAGKAGIYISDPSDLDEIASTLKLAIESQESMEEVALNQAAKFSWEETANQTINIYKKLLDK